MNDATLVISPSGTAVDQTTTFHVSYMINSKQVNCTIIIIVLNSDFNITIDKIVLGNSVLINLILESKDKSYNTNQWQITPQPDGVNFTDDPLTDIHLTEAQIRKAKKISIIHSITKVTDSGVCSGSASIDILFTDLNKAIEKHSFDNHFQF